MKKVKVMLMAIVVLAVAGGALAFKTKLGEVPFCTVSTTFLDGEPTCRDEAGLILTCVDATILDATTTIEDQGTLRCTTQPDIISGCNIPCPNITYTTQE